jgi:hypothetical protein
VAVQEPRCYAGLLRGMIGALENEQDDRVKVNGLFGSLNDWKG